MKLNTLVEMTRKVDFNFDKSNDEIQNILRKEKIKDFFLEDKKLNMYQCHGSSSGEYWYVIFNEDFTDVDFIIKFKNHSIILDDKKYNVMIPYHSFKKSSNIKSIVKKVYSYINKKFKKPILSDKKQTEKMVSLWINWFENQSKYSVKDFKFIDEKEQKILSMKDLEELPYGFYGSLELHERYRMMIDFNSLIKESQPIVLENKSQGIFYGQEGRDWVIKKD